MIRRILVAVDETPASRVALDLAIETASEGARPSQSVGVVDRPWATAPQAVPIGGSAYKVHRDQVVLDELRHEVEAILGTFAEACRTAGVLFSSVEIEDAPARAIESVAESCDLIVIGKDTNFHFEAEPDMTATVAHLIRENARPVLVTPRANRPAIRYSCATTVRCRPHAPCTSRAPAAWCSRCLEPYKTKRLLGPPRQCRREDGDQYQQLGLCTSPPPTAPGERRRAC